MSSGRNQSEQRYRPKSATQFKQIFTQGIKELGRKRAYEFFKERENEMISATVIDVTESSIILSLGLNTITHMPISKVCREKFYKRAVR